MGAKRPLLLALAISLTGHIAFVILYPLEMPERRTARFDLELLPSAPPPEQPTVAEAPSPVKAEPQEPTLVAETPPELVEPIPSESDPIEAAPEDELEPVAGPLEQPAVLDLSRPPGWDELVEGIPGPPSQLAFNPGLALALNERNAERRRAQFVSSRQAAIYGVADEDYARSGPLGEEVKMDGGCARLVEDKGVEEGQRWWASQCTETRQNRFTLPIVEYDALGRAVVD